MKYREYDRMRSEEDIIDVIFCTRPQPGTSEQELQVEEKRFDFELEETLSDNLYEKSAADALMEFFCFI